MGEDAVGAFNFQQNDLIVAKLLVKSMVLLELGIALQKPNRQSIVGDHGGFEPTGNGKNKSDKARQKEPTATQEYIEQENSPF